MTGQLVVGHEVVPVHEHLVARDTRHVAQPAVRSRVDGGRDRPEERAVRSDPVDVARAHGCGYRTTDMSLLHQTIQDGITAPWGPMHEFVRAGNEALVLSSPNFE